MITFPRSAYIHIPFCHRRCFYCDFPVIPLGDKIQPLDGNGSKTIKDYLNFLHKEILSIKDKSPLSTIYIGGGTPSILDPQHIKNLINLFEVNYGIDYGAEITMEVDPASFNEDDLNQFIKAGINRFSLGAQSFQDEILKKAGRRHLGKDVEKSCLWLKKAYDQGLIRSWSLDLIQNLPLCISPKWKEDLKKTLKYSPPHLSIYDLAIEKGTVFKRLIELGQLTQQSEDESFKNSELTNSFLKLSGYSRYEISNYSIPGHQSRHNRVYWSGKGWWGFGQGSTSAPWGRKLSRPKTSKAYKEWVNYQCENSLDMTLVNKEYFHNDLDEKIMLGMRLREGVNIYKLFKEHYWQQNECEFNFQKLVKKWEKFIEAGLLNKCGNRFFLSEPEGMELSNQVLISMFEWWDEINQE